MAFIVKELNHQSLGDFEVLAERHNGVWGGCYCTNFHKGPELEETLKVLNNKDLKHQLVLKGKAHAALVYNEDQAIAWCQFGPPEDLPNIYHRKQVEQGNYQRPDWRITCFFVDTKYRGQGVAMIALQGALDLIRKHGGGVVESYPQETSGIKTSSSFLYNATASLFRQAGFHKVRDKGKHHCIMQIQI